MTPHDPNHRLIDDEQGVLKMATEMGLPLADLVIEVGFGAGNFLIWRIANNWWPQSRHIAIDPLPIYAEQANTLKIFGVEWVAAIAANPDQKRIIFTHDPVGLTGFMIDDPAQLPRDWPLACFATTSIDQEYHPHYRPGESLWIRLDCGQGVDSVLAGARDSLTVADAVSVVINLNAEPMALSQVFCHLESAGLRCYRLVDLYTNPDTGGIITLTAVFVRLEKMPLGLPPLNQASIEATYAGLEERRYYNTEHLNAIADQALGRVG